MFIRRTDSYSSPVQKEFGLFGFLTGTGANAYETRRDLGNGYSEVTKNTLGNKISNFFNGTKKVRNQGAPGAGAASYRDGGVFAKIGNKAKAGYDSMKNSVSNALKSSNAMTPTGVVPKKMTKNPQATQLELFNRDGSPAFNANKPTLKHIQSRKPATIGGLPTMPGGLSAKDFRSLPAGKQRILGKANYEKATRALKSNNLSGLSNFEKKLAEDYHKAFVKNASPSEAAKRAFKFDESKRIIPRTSSRNPAIQPAPAFDKIRNRGNFTYTSKNSRQKRVENYHNMLNNSRPATTLQAVPGVPPIPSSQGIPRQAVSTSVNSRRLTNGVRNARLGRGYFGNLGSVKRLIRR